jgi:hypothetical protein
VQKSLADARESGATIKQQTNKKIAMKINNHIHKTVVTTLCFLSLSPALLFAADTPKPGAERGVIKSVDMDAHILVVTERKANSEQKFQWNDQTRFSERDKGVSAGALKEGERVHLTYTPGGDTPMLQTVLIIPARTEKHGANNLSPARSNGA